jgi:hypothetical protein
LADSRILEGKKVMVSFLGLSGREPPAASPQKKGIDPGQFKTLLEFFPIGKKLSYCPEFKEEIVFDTLIVAYCVNGYFVYSGDAIDRDSEGNPTAFRPEDKGIRIPVSGLKLLQLLVPDTTSLETTLDYQRRALIGRGRQFIKGNSITLISKAGTRGMSTVDTEVAKQFILPDGPYANTKMIFLSPVMNTLQVTDQRKKARARTSVPVRLTLPDGTVLGTFLVADISDGALRIRGIDRNTPMPTMNPGDEVILDINLVEAERHYMLKGSVFRRSSETCIIQLTGLFRDGRFGSPSALDLLELKAVLLNSGE